MSSLHDHNFKDLPTDWRHDGPLSARNDEKHLPPANAQPTPGALSAAMLINRGKAPVDKRVFPVEIENAMLIDRLAVKPATAELLAALQSAADQFVFTIKAMSLGQSVSISSLQNCAATARAIIAKHEGRT